MGKIRPYVLSIAGYDPSGGAGLLADIKTFEANKVYGLGVCSALTFQNDDEFKRCEWISKEKIIEQADLLFKKFEINWVKIGIIENLNVLDNLADYLISKNKKIKIIWDPILKASTGFDFHQEMNTETLSKIYQKIYLITPNFDEIKLLTKNQDALTGAKTLGEQVRVYLKGGHDQERTGKDYLFYQKEHSAFNNKALKASAKHGSGCVLSSALTSQLAQGYKIHPACLRAKSYVTKFLESNQRLLGYHKL